ncbi:MAG: undecaprenyl-phosphate glucose phosphotransferase [Candidatus Competibacteraceae bacterium]|nr:undecaprenyl-phosphate glucose phosphotransferase [Candidatus Competibacteraceae bacterium]
MLKKYRYSFPVIQHLMDAFAVALAWTASFVLRFYVLPEGSPGAELFFLKLTPLIVVITLVFFNVNRLYESHRYTSWYRETLSIFLSNVQAVVTFVLLLYYFSPDRFSRLAIALYLPAAEIIVVLFRVFSRNLLRFFRSKGKNLRYVLLVGGGQHISRYVASIVERPDSGIVFKGWLDSGGLASTFGIPEVANGSLEGVLVSENPDTVVIGYENHLAAKTTEVLESCYNSTISIIILPDLSYSFIGTTVDEFDGIPLIKVNQPAERFVDGFLKRSFDVLGSAIGLVLLSPLFLFVAVVIKLTSRGPVFYRQERMTMDGDRFQMVKFRTMKVLEGEQNATGWTTKDDPRKTRFGSFLRRTSIDEFPQLWNVFVGEMSLVGPRPERPMFVEQFRKQIPAYMLRHKVKGGMTGWAQINGWRGDTSIEKRLEFDLYYIRNWSLGFDVKILFLTFVRGFVNKNAY